MAQVLVDTSVWIRFLRGREPFAAELDALLEREEVLGHELVHGELLIGESARSTSRRELLAAYVKLPFAATVAHDEVVELVVARDLRGTGIGWLDAHLLASALVSRARLWTDDERLKRAALKLKVGG
ncbi:MAG: PIN domain-containing protein [Thermodesulfobacteriota bacterium]